MLIRNSVPNGTAFKVEQFSWWNNGQIVAVIRVEQFSKLVAHELRNDNTLCHLTGIH